MIHPDRFTVSCPTRIVFGNGTSADLAALLPPDARSLVFVTGASGLAAAAVLRDLHCLDLSITEIRCGAEPSVASIRDALSRIADIRPDAVVACGGGSVLDTGKLLAFLISNNLPMHDDFGLYDPALLAQPPSIPCIALPTTAGTGAEVTANAVVYQPLKAAKVSLRGRALHPAIAVVDPSLMKTGPSEVVLYSGLDAVTQVIEAYTSAAATPFSDALSYSAVENGLRALKGVIACNDADSWNALAWTSLASGLALANGGLGAVHGLAAVLGGRYDAPHGAICGRLLVPVLAQNLLRAEAGLTAHKRHLDCIEKIARVFSPVDRSDQLSGLDTWTRMNALPRLADWGIQQKEFNALAEEAQYASSSKKNAVLLTKLDFVQILETAF